MIKNLPIESFKKLLIHEQYNKCIIKTIAMWYTLTHDIVFYYLSYIRFLPNFNIFMSFILIYYFKLYIELSTNFCKKTLCLIIY